MTLRHRVRKLEGRVGKGKAKYWLVQDSYKDDKDIEGKKRVEKKILEIKEGKTKHQNGTYYLEGDFFVLLGRNGIDKGPDETGPHEAPGVSKNDDHREKVTPPGRTIEERIRVLKQRKEDLEKEIKESEK